MSNFLPNILMEKINTHKSVYYYLSWPFPLSILLRIQGRKIQDILKAVSKAAISNVWYIFLSCETKGFLNFSDISLCVCVCVCVCVRACAQLCPTLCNHMDCSLAGSSVHGIRQEYWSGVPFPSLGVLPDPGIEPASPALAGIFLTTEPLRKPQFKNL